MDQSAMAWAEGPVLKRADRGTGSVGVIEVALAWLLFCQRSNPRTFAADHGKVLVWRFSDGTQGQFDYYLYHSGMESKVQDGRGCGGTAGKNQFAKIDIEGQQPTTGATGKIQHGEIADAR